MQINLTLPLDWTELDLTGPDARALVGDESAAAIGRLNQGNEHVRLLAARALSMVEGETELAFTLVVTLTPASSQASETSLDPADYPDDDEVRRVALLLGRGIRRWTIAPLEGIAANSTVPALSVQYLLATDGGLLSMTFTTAKRVGDTERWDRLFSDIASAAWLVHDDVN